MKYFLTVLIFLVMLCSSTKPWVSYDIKYVGSEIEKEKFTKMLLSKNIEYRIIVHDSGSVYEIQYRSITQY